MTAVDMIKACGNQRRCSARSANIGLLLCSALLWFTHPSAPLWAETPSIALLDAMWADSNPIAHDRCLYFVVKAWAENVLRGRIAPHDCMTLAVREYRRGDHEHAMGWLQAGLCPDREAQQRLVREAPAVFEYLLRVYGPMVP
ncbi:hypothetical protein YTPLAS18_13770 [Nitrospira sp.]|nr:hypothetical protein YTPLAS18_13770 [Nitrospira sp.]